MSASRRFRRKHSRSGLNKLRKAYARQQREIEAEGRRAVTDAVESRFPTVQDAHTAGFVFAWLARLATPEILGVTS